MMPPMPSYPPFQGAERLDLEVCIARSLITLHRIITRMWVELSTKVIISVDKWGKTPMKRCFEGRISIKM